MLENLRKWIQTLALLCLGVGVLSMGMQGWVSDARAQVGGGVCEVVPLGQTDVQTASLYTQWLNGKLAQGNDQFMALPGVFPVVCAWQGMSSAN